MAATLKSIQTKRRTEKSSISRAMTFVQNPPAEFDADVIESRLLRLGDAFTELKDLTNQLYNFVDEKDFVDPEEDLLDYEEKFLYVWAILRRMQGSLELRVSTPDPHNDAFSRLAEQHSTLLQRLESPVNARNTDNDLPKIRIEPFNGQYKDWPAFKDLFTSAIDSKPNLTNIQKFHYLKSLLKDDAANLIKHMQITDLSYATAWDRLKERYDRPRHIVNSYIETFMSLSSVKEENSSGLRKISDISNEVIRGLEAIDYNERDHWLIYILQNKIDSDSRRKWIEKTLDEPKPTIASFLTFLDQRCEDIELGKNTEKKHSTKSSGFKQNSSTSLVATNTGKVCADCRSNEHYIHKCPHFLSLSVPQRRALVKERALCFNCLRGGHTVYSCKSQNKCRTCQRNHNTLIHHLQAAPANAQVDSHTSNVATSEADISHQVSLNTLVSQTSAVFSGKINFKRLLPTALADVRNQEGKFVTCRVLLDTASEYSYITEDCIKRLGLPRKASRMPLSGIQSSKADPTRGHSFIHIKSRFSQDSIDTFVHVLGHITASLPKSSITSVESNMFESVKLADPDWHRSSPIDILLGADEVWEILSLNKMRDTLGQVIAVSTIFGWVVTSGILSCRDHVPTSLLTLGDLDQSIRAFWEIEECPSTTTKLDEEELIVEQHFERTHSRHTDGKYIVELPFREPNVKFADTYKGALTRFNATERRLSGNPTLKSQYTQFMREYHSLGHMRELSPEEIDVDDHRQYYLPHHPIVGAKLRVVFDGSFL